MNINTILLIIAALVPAITLLIFIFKKDRIEKEPIGLLLILLLMGAVICFPAAKLELLLFKGIDACFKPFLREVNGQMVLSPVMFKLYTAVKNFIGVAMVEELLKFLVVVLFTRKSKNFNCLYDGIVYCVFVSLGFAAFENVLYVLQYGWGNAVLRALTAVPGHMFFAVIMGYYYSWAHIFGVARKKEIEFKNAGIIPQHIREFSAKKYWALTVLMPIMAHGFYDYCCSVGTILATILFYVFIIILYVICFKQVGKMSKEDASDITYSNLLLIKKYPQLKDIILQRITQTRQG